MGYDEWRNLLPRWFVDRCGQEWSKEEEEQYLRRFRQLSWPEQRESMASHVWSLADWIHWFRPENRYWYWWDAEVVSVDLVRLTVEVRESPIPWDALSWLLRASGARGVREDD